jgi:hypothetical protein
MFRLFPALALLALPCLAPAQTLSQGERDRAMSELHATRKAFLDIVSTVSEAQYNFKPSTEVWSIAEIAEHIVISETFIPKLSSSAPVDPETAKLAEGKDQAILSQIANREKKGKAPEVLVPKKTYTDRKALIAAFVSSRDANIAYLRDTKEPLRTRAVKQSPMGPMDAYQVYLLLAAHTQRHIDQMKEVQTNSGYPKK